MSIMNYTVCTQSKHLNTTQYTYIQEYMFSYIEDDGDWYSKVTHF